MSAPQPRLTIVSLLGWVESDRDWMTRSLGFQHTLLVKVRNRMRWPMSSLVAAYVLFGVFMLLESKLRQGNEAQSSEAGADDSGTTRLLGAGYGAGLLLLPIASSLRQRRNVRLWIGPLLMVGAIALRAWAARTLGRFYTRTLRTSHE